MTVLALFLPLLFSTLEVVRQDNPVRLGEEQRVTALSFNGKEFTGAFNATADRPRLVLVFSPT